MKTCVFIRVCPLLALPLQAPSPAQAAIREFNCSIADLLAPLIRE
jgi:hypothetical protein